ncbi:MAG: hypothetical protein EBZ77_11370, partial [Chitinophagia bacterium]|nr:hypothetical protein [Chitinophagia bacterium]
KGYMPLHMVFSPLERKRLLPDKGYNFLVHIARNLVAAFHKIHEAGLVAGDVNEGNLLINANGLVAFIDCDSFQVKSDTHTWHCEVGVPRYTPPELLNQSSFAHIERTSNTDGFSMAILVFQLLFLGRHPFAGINTSNRDLDEEAAIRAGEFAYSLSGKKHVLQPPPNTLPFQWLPGSLQGCFHRAFESTTRPSTAEWLTALDELLLNISICSNVPLHTYPAGAPYCPWCYFKEQKGILYFLDKQMPGYAPVGDVPQFVNGFNIADWEIPEWEPPDWPAGRPVQPIDRFARQELMLAGVLLVLLVPFGLLAVLNVSTPGPTPLVAIALIARVLVYWRSRTHKTIQKNYDTYKKAASQAKQVLDSALNARMTTTGLHNYNKALRQLHAAIEGFKQLHIEEQVQLEQVEDRHFYRELNQFLTAFQIADHDIPGIGNSLKKALLQHGIITAGHFDQLRQIKVPGIGPRKAKQLVEWQQSLSVNFVYNPDFIAIDREKQQVMAAIAARRKQLEVDIDQLRRQTAPMRSQIRVTIAARDQQLNELSFQWQEADDYVERYRKAMRISPKV